jgi:hypothetical protein
VVELKKYREGLTEGDIWGIGIEEIYKNLTFKRTPKNLREHYQNSCIFVGLMVLLVVYFILLTTNILPHENLRDMIGYRLWFLLILVLCILSGLSLRLETSTFYKYDPVRFVELINHTELKNKDFVDEFIDYCKIQIYGENVEVKGNVKILSFALPYNLQAKKQRVVLNFLYDVRFYLEQKEQGIELDKVLNGIEQETSTTGIEQEVRNKQIRERRYLK